MRNSTTKYVAIVIAILATTIGVVAGLNQAAYASGTAAGAASSDKFGTASAGSGANSFFGEAGSAASAGAFGTQSAGSGVTAACLRSISVGGGACSEAN